MRNLDRVLDQIAHEVQKGVRQARSAWEREFSSGRPMGREKQHESRFRGHADRWFREGEKSFSPLRTRFSDFAEDGSCAVRYGFGYFLKGIGFLQGLAGLIVAVVAIADDPPWDMTQLSVGLLLLATAQLIWWMGHLAHRSADRKRHAQYQHRLIRLAREKGGSLTVLEAATDARMTVEKAEELLRELAVRGHAEVRVSDSGLMVYHFPEIERWDEKHWAKPVDEL